MKKAEKQNISNGVNKKIIFGILLLSLFFAPVLSHAAISVTNPNNTFTDIDFLQVVARIATLIISFITILGIIFLVYGGILYVTSGGDENQAEKAKTTILYALIGLFIAASAYAIEKLILVTLLS